MPESNGLDMMQDLKDFWSWLFHSLQSVLGDEVIVDLTRILIEGDSAGSFHTHSKLSVRCSNSIKGAILPFSLP